ncbi:c-type cytochrome [Halovulum sp. GXIMD14794]
MRPAVLAALPLLFILQTPASAQDAEGNAERGQMLAEMVCADCHDVEPGGAFKEYPPSFSAIAVYRDRDQIFSRIYFPPYHAAMPQFGDLMVPNEVHDLVAYIQSLENVQR